MKFWDITLFTPLKANRRLGGTYSLHRQDRKLNKARYQHQAYCLLPDGFFFGSFFDREDGGGTFLWNIFNGLHDIKNMSQRRELFISTAVRTSNPPSYNSAIQHNLLSWKLSSSESPRTSPLYASILYSLCKKTHHNPRACYKIFDQFSLICDELKTAVFTHIMK
jgi:hypothetical protein